MSNKEMKNIVIKRISTLYQKVCNIYGEEMFFFVDDNDD